MLKQAARMLFTALLCVLLVGFGLCGAYGTLVGLFGMVKGAGGGESFGGAYVACGLIGLVIAGLCWIMLSGLWRKRPPSAE